MKKVYNLGASSDWVMSRLVLSWFYCHSLADIIEPRHEISNNVVCATSKGSDQPAHICAV